MARSWSSDPDAETLARLTPLWLQHVDEVRRAFMRRMPSVEVEDTLAELFLMLAQPNHAEQAERVGLVPWAIVRVRDVQRRAAAQRHGYHRPTKRKRLVVESDIKDPDMALSFGTEEADRYVTDADLRADVAQAMRRIPRGVVRQAVELRHLDQLEVTEIAHRQKVSVVAIYDRLHRAYRLLAIALRDYRAATRLCVDELTT